MLQHSALSSYALTCALLTGRDGEDALDARGAVQPVSYVIMYHAVTWYSMIL